MLATAVGKARGTGEDRRRQQDKGNPMAGKSTLNRMELGRERADDGRYKKIAVNEEAVKRLLVEVFLEA